LAERRAYRFEAAGFGGTLLPSVSESDGVTAESAPVPVGGVEDGLGVSVIAGISESGGDT
jgi:hypothetical protein